MLQFWTLLIWLQVHLLFSLPLQFADKSVERILHFRIIFSCRLVVGFLKKFSSHRCITLSFMHVVHSQFLHLVLSEKKINGDKCLSSFFVLDISDFDASCEVTAGGQEHKSLIRWTPPLANILASWRWNFFFRKMRLKITYLRGLLWGVSGTTFKSNWQKQGFNRSHSY